MKQVITPQVVFTPAAKTVRISEIPGVDSFDIRNLYAIINQTTGALIYSTASATLGYTAVTADTITLEFDTTAMSSADVLQIIYEVNDQTELIQALYELIDRLAFLAGARGLLGDIRVNATGGTIGTVSTVSTVSSITSVNSLVNMAQLGTFPAQPIVPSLTNIGASQGNINNIEVTIS
jgi:hypothetical protein